MDNSLITTVKTKRDFICKEESGLHGVRYTKFKPKLEKTSLLLLLLTDFKKISAAAVFKSLINLINLITALPKFFARAKNEGPRMRAGSTRAAGGDIHQYPRSGKSQHSAGAERGDTFAHVPSGHAAKAHQKRQYIAPAHAFFGSPSTGTVIRKEVFL